MPGPDRKTPPLPADPPAPGGRANTLGLSRADLDALLDDLDPAAKSEWVPFRHDAVVLEVSEPGGGQRRMSVASRGISRTSLSLLHSSFLHTGTPCLVRLHNRAGRPAAVHAHVVSCRHVHRTVHEVELAFREPVNVRDYVEIDAISQSFGRARTDPASLKGRLLIMTDCAFERAALEGMLGATALTTAHAPTAEAGLAAAPDHDVVLCDCALGGGPEAEAFLERSRAACIVTPVVMMSADTSPALRERVRRGQADGFLTLPLTHEVLHSALAEFLHQARERGLGQDGLTTSLPDGSPMLPAADGYAAALPALAVELRDAAQAGDVDAVRKRCLRLLAAAGPLGFTPVADAASAAVKALAATASVTESWREVGVLIARCRSARPRSGAPPAAAPAAAPSTPNVPGAARAA
jgi:CheY-like chemotaxis protein